MDISGISSSSLLSKLWQAIEAESVSSTSLLNGSGVCTADSVSDSTTGLTADFTKPAELYSKLQQLKEEDPEKFTQLMTDIAEKLKAAAAETDDENEKAILTDLAKKFQSVADGGDLSQLLPPPPPNEAYTSGSTNAYLQNMPDSSQSQSPLDILVLLENSGSSSASSTSDSSSSSGKDFSELLKSIFSELVEALA
jgi:hypothetical protein